MTVDLTSLDVESLQTLYNKNLELLNEKLLSGAKWSEVTDIRNFITQIGHVIDLKLRPIDGVFLTNSPVKSSL